MGKSSDDDRDENGYPRGLGVNYGVQNGSSNGNGKVLWWFLGGLMTLYVTLTGAYIIWTGNAIVDLKTDMAVIKCQLSPECPKVNINGKQ